MGGYTSLFEAKLASSGLDLADAAKLGLELLAPAEVLRRNPYFKALPAICLPYLDFNRQPLASRPKHDPFYRLRYLGTDTSFAGLVATKAMRYAQPPDSGVCAYLPHLIEWVDVVDDPRVAIIITEGEFKAAKACKDGFTCLGLGGVWNYRSAKQGISFLPELERINWVKRHVYLVYDSDFREKEGVVMALNALAEELTERGAIPFVVSLPELLDDGKTGLDDYLIHPAGGPDQLTQLLHRAQPLTLAKPLWYLNSQVVYVRDPGLIIEQASDHKLSPSAFKEHAYAQVKYLEQEFKTDGTVGLKKLSASGEWLKWQHRQEVASLTYAPGQPKFCYDGEKPSYNTWQGWGCEPIKGDTKPWHDLIEHLFQGAEPGAVEWFLDWCAWPLQYPGTKLFSAVVVHGIEEGTGKSLVGYTLGKIYGDNFIEIRQADLHSGRNDWAENKQFVLGDEVTGSDKRADADTLKKLITQGKIRIDIKYVPAYSLPDRINYYFTSNQPDSFFMGDKDRRYFIHEVIVAPLDESFYVDFMMWLDGRGPSHLFDELLKRDLSRFNPSAPAFMTRAKERMVADTRSDLGTWVRQLLADPDRFLRIGRIPLERDLVTNKDMLRLYDPDGSRKVTANGLGRELRRAGVALANKGIPVHTSLGLERLYIVRHEQLWADATVKELRAHVDDAEMQLAKARG